MEPVRVCSQPHPRCHGLRFLVHTPKCALLPEQFIATSRGEDYRQAGILGSFLFHLPSFFQSPELGKPHKCMCVGTSETSKDHQSLLLLHPSPRTKLMGTPGRSVRTGWSLTCYPDSPGDEISSVWVRFPFCVYEGPCLCVAWHPLPPPCLALYA